MNRCCVLGASSAAGTLINEGKTISLFPADDLVPPCCLATCESCRLSPLGDWPLVAWDAALLLPRLGLIYHPSEWHSAPRSLLPPL